jgi:hypothetical protein
MRQKYDSKPDDYKLFNVVTSFGASMAISVFLAYTAGNWLDARFGTGHTLMLALVIMAVVASIRVLIKDLDNTFKNDRRSGASGTGGMNPP